MCGCAQLKYSRPCGSIETKRRRSHFWGFSLNMRDMGCARLRLFILHVMSAEKERDTVDVSDIITFLRENQ